MGPPVVRILSRFGVIAFFDCEKISYFKSGVGIVIAAFGGLEVIMEDVPSTIQ